jgi:hypothetical protein
MKFRELPADPVDLGKGLLELEGDVTCSAGACLSHEAYAQADIIARTQVQADFCHNIISTGAYDAFR